MRVELNGEPTALPDGATVAAAIEASGAAARRGVAVAVDGEVVPRSEWDATRLHEGEKIEVLAAIQGGAEDGFELGGRSWGSRLIVGTGGFRSLEQMEEALIASGTEIVTVALRRVDPEAEGSVLDLIRGSSCSRFRIRRAATRHATPSERPSSPGRRSRPTGSSSR